MQFALDTRYADYVQKFCIVVTPEVVAWVIPGWGDRITPRGSGKLNGGEHSPRPTAGTIEGATHVQTPSQAEHGLRGFDFSTDG